MMLPHNTTEFLVNSFELLGTSIRIEHNSLDWLSSTADFLCLPQCDTERPADVHLLFLEVEGEEQANRIIPLPDQTFQQIEYLLQLNRVVPCRTYVDSPERWVDLSGYGRTWVDYSSGVGKVLRYKNCDIERFYDHLLFSFNLLNSLLAKANLYSVHAACVNVNGKGILFTGDSGSGKSTAAFAMLQMGQAVLSDERVLLFKADEVRAAVISDVIKVNRPAIHAFFPDVGTVKAFWETTTECYFKIGSIKDWSHAALTTVEYLMVLEKSGSRKTRLEKIHPARTVEHLFPVTLNPFESLQLARKFDFLARFLEEAECYRVHFGTDMKHFFETIAEFVAS